MDDLISRQAAIEYFQRIIDATNTDGRYNLGFIDGLEFCINHLLTMPSIQPEDVAPVVHAKWETGRCTNCHTDKPVVTASVVQGYMHQYQGRLNYCPNCGAKMEEEK